MRALTLLLAAALCCGVAHAQVPHMLNYQGFLTDIAGQPINTTQPMVFKLYTAASGGTALYTENQTVAVNSGIFSVVLGAVAPLNLAFDVPYYLGVSVGVDLEMTPRQLVTASPYALRSANADALAPAASVAGAQLTGTITSATLPTGNLSGTVGTAQIANNAVTQAKLSPIAGAAAGKVLGTDGANLQWQTASTGTVTSVGTGTGLSGGPITGSGTINLAPNQLLPAVSCAPAQIPKWSGSAWACAADNDTNNAANDARYFKQGGNAFGVAGVLGTTDAFALDLRVNGQRAMRYEPNAISPNVIGGSPGNSVTAGVRGATIAGGGIPVGIDDPSFSSEAPNRITDAYGTVGGGYGNRAGDDAGSVTDAPFGTVGGGLQNTAGGIFSTVGGGTSHSSSGWASTVGGGSTSTASGNFGTVGGGRGNSAIAEGSTVAGGSLNSTSGYASTVAGGDQNTASGYASTVGGGQTNAASASLSTVGGGQSNIASHFQSTVGGGRNNSATGMDSTVGGGHLNTASGEASTVGGGDANAASGVRSVVGGGDFNSAGGQYSTVGGGQANTASSLRSAIGGGLQNNTLGSESVVVGGRFNTASGTASTVAGGEANIASGYYSFAAGSRARTQTAGGAPTIHDGAFVWADNSGFDFHSAATAEFAARATGGVRFVTAIDVTGTPTRTMRINPNGELEFGNATRQMLNLYGPTWAIGVQSSTQYFRSGNFFGWYLNGIHSDSALNAGSGGTILMALYPAASPPGVLPTVVGEARAQSFVSTSDRNAKRDFLPVDTRALLKKVVALPIATWAYRTGGSTRHIGPVAQDFKRLFEVGGDDLGIATVDADGVALAAIQGLHAKLEEKDAQLARQQAEIDVLKGSMAELQRALRAMTITVAAH